jgi:hypothetical protein
MIIRLSLIAEVFLIWRVSMEELKQIVEQQNQRIEQLERILNHSYFKAGIVDWRPGVFDSIEEKNQFYHQTWSEILSKLETHGIR